MVHCTPFRSVLFVIPAFLAILLATSPASALDIDRARADGQVLREALAAGERGDWAAAEAMARARGDLVLQDIVLWRKLRARAGTVAEYQSFVARRGTWPGLDHLAEAVLGERPGKPESGGTGMTADAAARWREFSSIWSSRDYDAAARYLDGVSESQMGNARVWADRRAILARREAREGRGDRAYRLASRHGLTPAAGYDYSDHEWIAGWVALRKLNDPARAVGHFERFEASVETPISLGRGGYWIGRAYEAMGDESRARAAYARGALHQTSFYGQLAAQRIGAPGDSALTATELPDWRKSPAMRSDDVRMAAIVHFAGEDSLAFQAFVQLSEQMEGGAALGALAQLALDLGKPNYAVRIAKKATRKGEVLMPAYYPVTELADYARAVEPALAMSIARQETELNPTAISHAGARGLMQVMPATAKKVAGWIGEAYSPDRLTADWRYNARLGQAYLARRIGEFGGSYVLAAAAYNAGKGRVDQWIAERGDPRMAGKDMIDWMEEIPFSETRNYVQRVMEGIYIYRSRLTGKAGPMTIVDDLSRGSSCAIAALSC
jgi:soluble lytic murein transglycosylase